MCAHRNLPEPAVHGNCHSQDRVPTSQKEEMTRYSTLSVRYLALARFKVEMHRDCRNLRYISSRGAWQ